MAYCGDDINHCEGADSLSSAKVPLRNKTSDTLTSRKNNRISQQIQLFEHVAQAAPLSAPDRKCPSVLASAQKSSTWRMEPIYINVEDIKSEVLSTKAVDVALQRKKPVPKPRKSTCQSVSTAVHTLLNTTPEQPKNNPVKVLNESSSDEAALTVNNKNSSAKFEVSGRSQDIPEEVLPEDLTLLGPALNRQSTPCSPEPRKISSLKNNEIFLKLNEFFGDDHRKAMTLPSGIIRPVFDRRLSNIDASDIPHLSQRPLPEVPVSQMDGDLYDDSTGEPIYQSIPEQSDPENENSNSDPSPTVASSSDAPHSNTVKNTRSKRDRRCGKNFRSLRGLSESEAPLQPHVRAASFTTADLPEFPANKSNSLQPHSSSCSSVSLAGSDSGVSLGPESSRDDNSVRELKLGMVLSSAELERVSERMRGFQARSESLYNNASRVKAASRLSSDKTRRHTLPISVLPTTVFDDEQEGEQFSEISLYPSRCLWSQQTAVKESGILNQLSEEEKNLQEAVYEIIATEGSHLRSLNILIDVFKSAPELSAFKSGELSLSVISAQEEKDLFLNIVEIRDTSYALLKRCHQRCLDHQEKSGLLTMPDISDILDDFCRNNSKAYVSYCSNQHFQDQALTKLKDKKQFQETIKKLESNPVCEQLDFRSYLMLPMLRVTKLPLLLSAVTKRLQDNSSLTAYSRAMAAVNKVVKECDDGLNRVSNTIELCRIDGTLKFDAPMKRIPIISASRALVKRGRIELIQVEHKVLPRRMNIHRKSAHMLVFNDLLILAKPKSGSEEPLYVMDYCQRIYLDCLPINQAEQDDLFAHTAIGNMFVTPDRFRGFKLTLLKNAFQKTVEFFVIIPSESDYLRWMAVLNSSERDEGDHRVYDPCNCPKYEIVVDYDGKENDELSLRKGDAVDVYRKSKDGWLEGRNSNGHRGWFPANVANEIVSSDHAKARLLKERERLLAEAAKITNQLRN